jgi:anaerobic magnesium-protoporphyrin IX monomethyl ester cyclase
MPQVLISELELQPVEGLPPNIYFALSYLAMAKSVTIVFPPAADPSLPYGALPLLGAVLKRAGHTSVSLRDINLEVFEAFLRPEMLREAAKSQAAEDIMGWETAQEVVNGITEARRVMRDPADFYDPAKLLYAKRIFTLAGELVTAEYPELSFGKYSYSSRSYDSYDDVATAVERDGGPLAGYFRAVTVPSLLATKPDVIGISVPYFSQLIPMFLLAAAIREQDPGVHITCGGPVVTWGKEVLMGDARFGRWIDSFFAGEADETFLHFIEALDGTREMSSVANVVRYHDGEVISQLNPAYQLNLDWLPAPDFSMMPMDRYFAPQRIICLVPTRGCYFNKCAFCNYAFIKMAPYRMRKAALIAGDVASVQQATGDDVFCFESDVILPMHLRQIAEAIIAENLDVKWHAVARFEKGFSDDLFTTMRQAGCVRIYMGLESASDRVLKAMVKGTDSRRMTQILHMCHNAGIAVEAGVFSDFPSETAAEAEETYRFIRDHQHVIARADVGTFRLLKGAPIADTPELYGITLRDEPSQRWYHLDYDESAARSPAESAGAMERIQRLYPEVALIDVPEDILYTARLGSGAFRRFFDRSHPSAGAAELPDAASLHLASGCELQRVLISNSGAVHFDAGQRPAFEASRHAITVAVDRSRRMVYPLNEAEERLLTQICDNELTVSQARELSTPGTVANLIGAGLLVTNVAARV